MTRPCETLERFDSDSTSNKWTLVVGLQKRFGGSFFVVSDPKIKKSKNTPALHSNSTAALRLLSSHTTERRQSTTQMATTTRGTKILRFTPGSNSFVATTQQTNQLLSCSLASWSTAPTPTIPLSTLARRTDGTTFGLNKTGDVLFHVDVPTGVTTRIGKLALGHHGMGHFSGTIKHVRGLAFSDQPHELWGILPCQTLKNQHVDCMIQINTNTGLVTSLHQLNRTDVMAIAVPPRAGGSWRGTTHFLWCASGGLYALKNPNEGYELKRIGTCRDKDASLVVVVVVGGVLTCHVIQLLVILFLFRGV